MCPDTCYQLLESLLGEGAVEEGGLVSMASTDSPCCPLDENLFQRDEPADHVRVPL